MSQASSRKIAQRISPVYRPVLRHGFQWLSSATYRAQHRELERLRRWPTGKEGVTHLLPYPVEFIDAASFLSMWREIFGRGLYNFQTESSSPRIIDGGANIGLASLFWKSKFPEARITAFEPDPKICEVLSRNLKAGSATDVEVQPYALWNANTTLSFSPDNADGGHIEMAGSTGDGSPYHVEAKRLAPYLEGEVDFLKLDIEGAEMVVLRDCAASLVQVKQIFIEYHGFPNRPQELPEMLLLLQNAGFRLHVQSEFHAEQPFCSRSLSVGMDNRINVFGWRETA